MTASRDPEPDFLVIGAARSGTTSLTRALAAVPGIFIPQPLRPEPHFFMITERWERGFDWYAKHYFGDAPDGTIRGEKSSSYLCSGHASLRTATCVAGVKLVAMLREPIARAHSSWRFTRANGLEPLDFEAAIAAEPERLADPPDEFHREVRPHAYLERSRYGEQLLMWLEHHPREHLHVIIFERFAANPVAEMRALLTFLGADPAGADDPEVRRILDAAHNVSDAGDGAAAGPSPEARRRVAAALADDREDVEAVLGEWPAEWSSATAERAEGTRT